jgi:sugar/nucleoside kinase (ribokinase family)
VARLGAGSLFISAIGQDELGDQFVALLQGECVVQKTTLAISA